MLLASVLAVAAAAPFTLYSSLPMQGASHAQSRDMVRAIRFAVDDHHDRAGGHPLTYSVLDDSTVRQGGWDAGQTVTNARKAAVDTSTIAYIGDFNSGASANSIPTLNQAGILQVSPSNTARGLTKDGPGAEAGEPTKYYPTGTRTYGRIVPIDDRQAAVQVQLMRAAGVQRLYVLDDQENYGTGIATLVRRRAKAAGVTVVGHGEWDGRRAGYRGLARTVSAKQPDAIFLGGLDVNNTPQLALDLNRALPDAKLFGPDGLTYGDFTKEVPMVVQAKLTLTNPVVANRDLPAAGRALVRRFTARYHHTPDPYAIYAYAATDAALDAVDAAGTAKPGIAGLRRRALKTFFGFRHHASVLGPFSIDAAGDTTLKLYGAYGARNGRLVYRRAVR